MKLEDLLKKACLSLPLRVETRNEPIADTGDYNGVTSIEHSNGGESLAEVWNGEDHEDAQLHYLAHCGNQLPPALQAMRKALTDLQSAFKLDTDEALAAVLRIEEQLRKAIAAAEEVSFPDEPPRTKPASTELLPDLMIAEPIPPGDMVGWKQIGSIRPGPTVTDCDPATWLPVKSMTETKAQYPNARFTRMVDVAEILIWIPA